MSDPQADRDTAPRVGGGAARLYLAATGLIGLAIFCLVLVASIHRTPGIGGVMTGLFTGLFVTLLFILAAVGFLAWLASPKRAKVVVDNSRGVALGQALSSTLAELEAVRLQISQTIHARAAWMVPTGAVAGLAFWVVGWIGKPGKIGVLELIMFVGVGGLGGYIIASNKLSARYGRLYKDRVLPLLAAQFGALSYRQPPMPDLERLRRFNIFGPFDEARAEDEIFGRYRGLEISIVQLHLSQGSGDKRQTVFNGLLAEVALKNRLLGTTAVVADAGVFGNLRQQMADRGVRRVGLEDPVFEREYEVYSTDQVMARALLTPTFMERWLALAHRSAFELPLALAQDERLLLVLPRLGGANLFKAPDYGKPAASAEALTSLHDDIQSVLRTADSVIDLDDITRAKAEPG